MQAKLFEVVKVMTRNLNKVIDLNYYPVKEAENSNLRHRPIGIGTRANIGTESRLRPAPNTAAYLPDCLR